MSVTAAEVRETIAGILEVPVDTLTDKLGVGDIPQWESLAHMAILTTLEEEYGLHIPEEQMMDLATVGSIIAFACGTAAPSAISQVSPSPAISASVPEPVADSIAAPTVPAYDKQPVVLTLQQRADEHPAKTALIFDDEAVTYRQLVHGIRRAVTFLQEQGVKAGDVVALYAEKTKEFYFCYFGVHLMGAAVLNLDPAIKEERRRFIFEQTQPCYCLGSGLMADKPFSELHLEQYAPNEELTAPAMDAVAEIMFTTGTTGAPKGVLLTQANIAASSYHINTFLGTNGNDVDAIALPVCHSFGIGRSRCMLTVGGTIVLVPGFSNPMKLFTTMHDYKVTGLAIVPAAWAYLYQMSGDKLAEYATHLRYMEIGGAPMPVETKHHLMELFPNARICMYYGLTEASRSTFMEFRSESEHLDSVGRPSPGVAVRIYSEDGRLLTPGNEGEICIKGNHVMKGYLHDTGENTYYGSYFRSGDWGYMDKAGYIHVCSRKKDMINVGGKKVSPEEVETILNSIPGVTESACVAAPDPQGILGEVVKAIVVSDGVTPQPTDETIIAVTSERLEHYKVPVFIEWRDAITRTASGKIQRQFMK